MQQPETVAACLHLHFSPQAHFVSQHLQFFPQAQVSALTGWVLEQVQALHRAGLSFSVWQHVAGQPASLPQATGQQAPLAWAQVAAQEMASQKHANGQADALVLARLIALPLAALVWEALASGRGQP
jgi:hypothetical protein